MFTGGMTLVTKISTGKAFTKISVTMRKLSVQRKMILLLQKTVKLFIGNSSFQCNLQKPSFFYFSKTLRRN